jgi:hypothetical protein
MAQWMSITALTLIALCGCQNDRIDQLEKENQALKVRADRVQDFDLQAKCSTAARTWFNENWGSTSRDKETILLDFSNHYNKSSNQCFIVVEYHFAFGDAASWMEDITLWDVYENSKVGDFSENHEIDLKGGGYEARVYTCELYGKKCTTADEFNGLVQPYMSN